MTPSSVTGRCLWRRSVASCRPGWQRPSDGSRRLSRVPAAVFVVSIIVRNENRVDALVGAMARCRRTCPAVRNHRLVDRVDPDRITRDFMATEPATTTTPSLRRTTQSALYARALETMPGGTDSNFRAWGEDTVYVDRGKGGMVWDLDGNEYIDLRMGYGPVILGHGDERVDDYVNERMRKGVSFSLTSEDEIRAMELVKELTGWVDMARMTVSGTEATMHAMRLARAFTGRNKIVKFEGQYHGVHDYALISVGPDNMSELGDAEKPVRLMWGRGIPEAVADTIIPARYNNLEFLRRLFEEQGDDIAAVIVEPIMGNAQAILPEEGFHAAVRAMTEEFGILLIFDEVKTGFRLAKGGASEYFGVTPDIATFAKAMGNGYPAAAFAGKREIMELLP